MSQKEIIDGLQKILADSFVLYFKTHSYHWNVTGPQFKSLHDLFGEQYEEIWTATDDIAEQIRVLGEFAPNSFQDLLNKATLKEAEKAPDADTMVKILAEDNLALANSMKPVLNVAAEAGDESTVAMLSDRITVHEKAAWMLRSSVGPGCCC